VAQLGLADAGSNNFFYTIHLFLGSSALISPASGLKLSPAKLADF
jgi:hypothetical protein